MLEDDRQYLNLDRLLSFFGGGAAAGRWPYLKLATIES